MFKFSLGLLLNSNPVNIEELVHNANKKYVLDFGGTFKLGFNKYT